MWVTKRGLCLLLNGRLIRCHDVGAAPVNTVDLRTVSISRGLPKGSDILVAGSIFFKRFFTTESAKSTEKRKKTQFAVFCPSLCPLCSLW